MITDFLKIIGSARIDRRDLNSNSFDDYLRKLEGVRPGIHVVPLVGHSTVRMCCMGLAARKPSVWEMRDLQSYVSRAMQADLRRESTMSS